MPTYVGARDLAGRLAFVGTHQFIVLLPENGVYPTVVLPDGRSVQPRKLGKQQHGFVIGAQNNGRLIVEYFEKSDYQATLEFFDPVTHTRWYRSDFDTEMRIVKHDIGGTEFIRKIIRLVNNYIINEQQDNIPYPFSGLNVNSNSWTQSLIHAANGKVSGNFTGLDISHDKRIPAIYFEAICPVEPRPKVNQ
ncbi:hypothetical protein [Bowmanella denitrificans]|uniref:hypothetical protein n=1 Tax=Bowmanella denitrificans TaxID=366582 RepID=UPI000C99CC29|nr:hypothetical protein [Bowmanella denitrificans]